MNRIEIEPIGVVRSDYREEAGTPIQPKFSHDGQAKVVLNPELVDGLKDLEGFDRIWLIFWLDRAKEAELQIVPYRDDRLHGVFATRSPQRPNPIGISAVKLDYIKGNEIYISEHDILDGTPLLDIKPYSSTFDVFEEVNNGT